MITQEEWRSHSEEWRRGWNDYTGCKTMGMTAEEVESQSDEWKEGARYAMIHPFGAVAIPM